MKKFGFYLLGQKGFEVLSTLLEKYGSGCVQFVYIGKDGNIENDYSLDIENLCINSSINYSYRNENPLEYPDSTIRFAIGWKWLIKDENNLIVIHDSLLPKYRGFSPLVNMLINKENELGVTALFASENYDSGDIIEQESILIDYPIRVSRAIDEISKLYSKVVLKIVENILSNSKLIAVKQVESEATYSLWRDELDYNIDWSKSSYYIRRFIDSVSYPYLGASTYLSSKIVRVIEAFEEQDVIVESREDHIGKVIFYKNGYPCIVCGEGILAIKEICINGESFKNSDIPFRSRFTSTRF